MSGPPSAAAPPPIPSDLSPSLYRQIVESGYEGIWVFDLDGTTAYVNARMAAIAGPAGPKVRPEPTRTDHPKHGFNEEP